MTNCIPSYLKGFEKEYAEDPRGTNLQWFKDARYGLFMHYGLYSLLERHEWVQLSEKIPVDEYAKLKESFTAENFDADHIASFAVDCGMKYINITTRHHDSFCLWDTKETDFNSVNSPAKRDLVGELASACEKHGLALFLYYSHGRDWKHPHAPNNDEWGGSARPQYSPPEQSYKYGKEHDLNNYLEFMKRQIKELLTNYPTIAGIWLDGIAVPTNGDTEKFKCQELYDYIYILHPHALVSYKQGLTGTEDYFAPEHRIPGQEDGSGKLGKVGDEPNKLIEICTTMISEPLSWGYYKGARHKTVQEVLSKLEEAGKAQANLLINTGPMPDGSLDPDDEMALREAGTYIRKNGFPS